MPDDRNLLDPTMGDEPSKEFVDSLWERLDAAWDATGVTDGDAIATDVSSVELQANATRRRSRGLMSLAAAVIVVVVIGIVVFASRDEERGTETVDQPDEGKVAETERTPSTPQPTTAPGFEPPGPVYPDFEITIFEVEGDWLYADGPTGTWAARREATEVVRVDPATNAVVAEIGVPVPVSVITVGPHSVWVGQTDGTILRIDPVEERIEATIDVGAAPGWTDVDESAVWIGTDNAIVRVDKATNTVAASIDVPAAGVPMIGAGGIWFGDGGQEEVIRIDPETNEIVARVPAPVTGGFAAGPAAVWKGDWSDGGVVRRIDPATNDVAASVAVGEALGFDVITAGLEVTAGSVWLRYVYDCGAEAECTSGIARIDARTNEVLSATDLPQPFSVGGLRVGPSSVWVTAEGVVARIDFSLPPE